MPIFDTHAHYDDEAFDADREQVLLTQQQNGVEFILNCCASLGSLTRVPTLAHQHDFMYFAAGLHPENLQGADDATLQAVEALLQDPKCLAVGEIGLDYYWNASPKEVQIDWFSRQITLAKAHDLPVVVHDRDAHGDTVAVLRDMRPRGVLHAFSGSAEMAKEVLSMGFYLGIGGAFTFKNNKKAPEVLAITPLDRMLLETDCPYLSPVPLRGTRNESRNILHVAQFIAAQKGVSVQEILDITAQNARDLFGLAK